MKKALIALLIIFPLSEASGREAKRYFIRFFTVYGGAAVSSYSPMSPWATIPELRFIQHSATGAVAGIGYEVPVNKRLSIDVRVQYARKGASLDWWNMDQFAGTWTYKLFTLSDATTIKFKILPGSSPYILGGYDIAWVFSHKLADSGGLPIPSSDLSADTNDVDIGVIVGIGAELVLKGLTPFVEARYNHGFLNLSKQAYYFPTARTRALLLTAGIKIHVK